MAYFIKIAKLGGDRSNLLGNIVAQEPGAALMPRAMGPADETSMLRS
jgi:hypothetical protein